MSIHRRYDLLADPELDSDFFGADFSAAGLAAGLDEVDGAEVVAGEAVAESDFEVLAGVELSAARESVR